MKFLLSLLVLGFIYTAHTLPINEPSTNASGSAATIPIETKVEAKSELPSTPSTAEKQAESSKETSSLTPPAPALSAPSNDEQRSPLKEAKLPEAIKSALSPSSLPILEVTQPTKEIIEPSTGTSEAAKPIAPIKETVADASKSETPAVAEIKVEQQPQAAVASEQPKESNNQVNAVSVDEPKLVQNDVAKSELVVKDEVKSELVKDEVKMVEKSQESNERNPVVASVPAPMSDVSGESKSNEKVDSSEEQQKKISSSEEKNEEVSKEEKKEVKPIVSPVAPAPAPMPQPEKKVESTEAKPENKPEKTMAAQPQEIPASAGKSEESSVKPVVEATEQLKVSSTAAPAAVVSAASPQLIPDKAEKKESEREPVNKREAGKDKYDEKKPVDGFPKKEKVKASQNKESSHDTKRE